MASLPLAFAGALFVALGYANLARPKAMWKLYHWPLSAGETPGEGDETVFRRRGYAFGALGVLLVLWALSA